MGFARVATRIAVLSRSSVDSRCSTASAGRVVGLVPVRGAQLELAHPVGLAPLELGEQELAEQRVVPEPLPPAVERDEEHVRRLEPAQLLVGAGFVEHRVAQGRAQVLEHGGVEQELLGVRRQPAEGLPLQVVGHVPVVTGDRDPSPPPSRAMSDAR